MNGQLKLIWLEIFILLFGIKIGAFFDMIWIYCLIIIFYVIVIKREKINLDIVFLLIFFYGFYSLSILMINRVYDYWHVFQPIRAMINYLGISLIINRYYKSGLNWKHILSMSNLVIYFHAIIVITTFLSPDLRLWIGKYTGFIEASYIRSPGLTHSYGITSLLHIFPFLTVPFTKNSTYNTLIDYIGLSITFISLFFLARVGLYLTPLIMLSTLSYLGSKRKLDKMYLFLIFSLGLSVFLLIKIYSTGFVDNLILSSSRYSDNLALIYFNEIIRWSLEIIVSTLSGKTKIASVDGIGDFIFFNNSIFEYFFGTGLYGRLDIFNHLKTDQSYAHFFSMVGIVGILIIFLIYLSPLIFYKNLNKELRFIYFIFTLVILITNYKEATFFTRTLFSLWSINAVLLKLDFKKNSKQI